jgi:hypothetical protein
MILHKRAASDVRLSRCSICSLPGGLRAEIDDNRGGVTKAAMIRVLRDEGHAVTRNRLNYHEQERHHWLLALPKGGKADTAERARPH